MKNKIIIIISTLLILLVCVFVVIKFVATENNNLPEQNTIEDNSRVEQDIESKYISGQDSDEEQDIMKEYHEAVITEYYDDQYCGEVSCVDGTPATLQVKAIPDTISEYGFNYGYTDNCISFLYDITNADSFEILNTDVSNNKYYYDIVINDHVYSIAEDEIEAFVIDQHLTKEEALERIAIRGYL